MKLHTYLNELAPDRLKQFAAAIGVDEKYLLQLKSASKRNRHRFPSWKVCKKIEEFSGGAVTEKDLRPDVHDPAYVPPSKVAA